METETSETRLNFVNIEDLLAYGEAIANAPRVEESKPPPKPKPTIDRNKKIKSAIKGIQKFVSKAQKGSLTAEAYRTERQLIIEHACDGDELVFYVAWNYLLAEGALIPLLISPIGSIQKPIHRRPASIVSRDQLTTQLIEGQIVLDLGNDRFWLLPKELSNRSLLFTMRHGLSRVDSGKYRVGRRLKNVLDEEEGVSRADAVGKALAKMLGVVGHQLEFFNLPNYLDPKKYKHRISKSPNTKQLFERIIKAIIPKGYSKIIPEFENTLESQDFGWVTGVEKKLELQEAVRIFGCDESTVKKLLKNPLYCYPAGQSFFDFYVHIIDGFHQLARNNEGEVVCLYTHSSTLRALIIYLDPRPFKEAFSEFGEYKEKQDNVVLLASEQGNLMGYSTAVGLSAIEQERREAWISVEQKRKDLITLKPGQLRKIVALVSGGDFAGAGATLKELRVAAQRFGAEVYFAQHGFLGLANKWINRITEEGTRGMVSRPSSPIGSSRFEDFKDERVQNIAVQNLKPYMDKGVLIVIGGDGSFRGARALFERQGVQVVGIPGSIDNNINGTTSLGFHSAIAHANLSLESLKSTSAAMGSIFFVEVMGAGSGHIALACGFQARAEGVLVNEHPDPDTYIDKVILGTLKRTLGVSNKSHLFIVAEKTPHRHHPQGGVHGLTEYVSNTISQWRRFQKSEKLYSFHVATKATILGHTLRGALPTPEDKALGQFLAYEAIQRLVDDPASVIGCILGSNGIGHVEPIPLHAVTPKPFDWQLFVRMHGNGPISFKTSEKKLRSVQNN
ncbi:MAG: 6-phosphofructokinase [Thermodesulfobacteriota bacterium]